MSNWRLIIAIWGAAIVIFLLINNASGTSTVVGSSGTNFRNFTRALQGF